MWILLRNFIFLLLTAIVSGNLHLPRITGGHDASDNQFPFMVGILRRFISHPVKYGWCAGSLLSNKLVLSAAHCVTPNVKYVEVYLGNRIYRKGISHQIQMKNIVVYEKFDTEKGWNDICLIRIPYTAYTPAIQAIELPESHEDETFARYKATIAGWGQVSATVMHSEILQYQELMVMNKNECMRQVKYDHVTQICCKTEINRTPCNGDSGGPLTYYDDSESKLILIGVLSYNNDKTCSLGRPVVFTRITKYLDWIKSKVDENYSPPNKKLNDGTTWNFLRTYFPGMAEILGLSE